MKKKIKFIFLVIFFSVLMFFIRNYFFWSINPEFEESYIEKTVYKQEEFIHEVINKDEKNDVNDENIVEKIDSNIESEIIKKITFLYFPDFFENEVLDYTLLLKTFLEVDYIYEKFYDLKVEFYMDLVDVRWKMNNKTLKLFSLKEMNKSEFMSVSIHELAHYIDIYFLSKKVFTDISDYFYNISWESAKIIKSWQKQTDFVSWYAMTNKYEDFAESLTYYLLHNNDFSIKSKKSKLLKKKYDFFSKYLFRKWEFLNSDFSWWWDVELKDYYRDITKIDFNLDIFLQFLKK